MNETQNPEMSEEKNGVGYLVVKISTARGAIPVADAMITVYGTGEDAGGVYAVVTSDSNGIAAKIPIPTPPKSASESSGQPSPYATYGIEVVKAGYYDEIFSAIPIFDTVTSVQNVYLVPISSGNASDPDKFNNTVFRENANPDL